MIIVFSHGKESGPWGSKISRLAKVAEDLNCEVESIDYTGIICPDRRLERLKEYLDGASKPFILVGSSMGGYVSLAAAQQYDVVGVFLLAPALYMPDYNIQEFNRTIENVEIVHGWSDEVIPNEHSIKYAQKIKCCLHLIDDSHRLSKGLSQIENLFKLYLKRVM